MYIKIRRIIREYRSILHVHQDPENNSRVPFKIQNFAYFSLVSLRAHPRSRRGAERIRQGEGRWSSPPKTALERSNLTEKSQFQASHIEAETKKTPDRIPPKGIVIHLYKIILRCQGFGPEFLLSRRKYALRGTGIVGRI